jgi:hypothetical protein
VVSALWDFVRTQAWIRRARIWRSSEVWFAVVLAVLFAVFGSRIAIGDTGSGDVIMALLTYAAIAFGFAIAGLTLALTAPDREFAQELALSDPEGAQVDEARSEQNSYSNLLFIFSWTALAHWLLVVGSLVVLLAIGKDVPLLAHGSSARHRIGLGVLAFVAIYAVELFLITLITLGQVGQAYIGRLQRSGRTDSKG